MSKKWQIRIVLLCGLYFIIRCFVGCSTPDCLTSEHKYHQRHWYDEKHATKRSNAKMWWGEHGQQGMILAKREERKLYKP
jgi:hypothetical protein